MLSLREVIRVLLAISVVSCITPRPIFADVTSAAQRHFQSGLAYERLGRYNEAYTELQLATNLDPIAATSFLALGVVASRLGLEDESLRALEHSIAIDARSSASYYLLAFLYEKKGLTDRAIESWQRFLQLTTDSTLKVEGQKHLSYLESLQ